MRRFTRISLIVAGILVIVGFALAGTGVAMAGGVEAVVQSARNGELDFGNWHFKDGIYYSKEEWSRGYWSKDTNSVSIGNVVENVANTFPVGQESITDEFQGEVRSIDVETDLANIVIRAADVEVLCVTMEEGYLNCYKTEWENGELTVSYKKRGKNYKQGPKITIEVPRNVSLEEVSIENALGEVFIADFEQGIAEIEIAASLGNVTIENCKMDKNCYVGAALGNICMKDVVCQAVELEANLGNIEVYGSVEKEIDAQADMGNVDVVINGAEEEYNIELDTNMGDIFYNGAKQKGEISCSHQLYHEHAAKYIALCSDMGNVSLKFK